MRSLPMSAILVKMPPAMRRAAAPTVPGDEVGAEDTYDGEGEDEQDAAEGEAGAELTCSGIDVGGGGEDAEVDGRDCADEDEEFGEELALLDHVGLAGGVDEFRDVEHALVDGEAFELEVDDQAEDEAEDGDDKAGQEQVVPADGGVEELDVVEVGDDEVGLAGGALEDGCVGVDRRGGEGGCGEEGQQECAECQQEGLTAVVLRGARLWSRGVARCA